MKGLYKNFFFHPDILIMFLFFISGGIVVFFRHPNFTSLWYFALGMFLFAVSEYFTHRFFFHLKTPGNPLFLKFLKRIHYDHHTYPDNLKLLFLPLWYSIPNFLVISGIFFYFNQNFISTLSFGLGLMGMLLIYEWKHYVAHMPIKPKTHFGRWIKKVHLLHHYKNENYWFGVSTPFADFLFGTFKNEKQVETSKTAKNLENRAQ